jgi:hypothetical protein
MCRRSGRIEKPGICRGLFFERDDDAPPERVKIQELVKELHERGTTGTWRY